MNKHGVAPLSARDAGSGSRHGATDAANSGARRSVAARSWPWLAAALSGCLLFLAFPPWNFAWLAWIALVPLICAVWFSSGSERTRRRRAIFLGYLTGITFFAAVFSWLGTLGELFEQPWLRALPIILSLYLGLYFAFWAWFIALIPREPQSGINEPLPAKPRDATPLHFSPFCSSSGNLLIAFLGASAWVSHEWVRGWLFSGFGWNGLGIALHRNLPMIQIVDVAGVAALSFLLVFCNLMFVIVAARLRAELGPTFFKRVRWEFSLSMAIVVAVLAYGVAALRRPPPVTKSVRIAAVQPNVPQHEKFSVSSEDRIFERLNTLTTLAASTAPDLIVWPESATHRGMYADERNYQFVRAQALRGDFGLLLGSVDFDLANAKAFNVAFLLTDRGETVQPYRKIHLVPFGEYLPLRESFPLFAMIAGELVAGDFSAGTEFTVLELPRAGIRLAALICFEDTLGDLTRQFVGNGAQLLVNLTNDGWFLTSPAVEQHLANAIFRAVETRRPLVRCGNTGVTCAIDRFGRIDRWLPPFQRGFFARDIHVPMNAPQTFYTRWGEWFAITAAIITAVALARHSYLKRRSRSGKPDPV